MTDYPTSKDQWWEILENNWRDIKSMIMEYYPLKISDPVMEEYQDIVRDPEAARRFVVDGMRKNEPLCSHEDLSVMIESMKKRKDVKLHSILESVWMGIPESRSLANSLPGFYILCDLCSEGYVLYEGYASNESY